MKTCDTCKQDKELSDFNKNKSKKDGLNSICRECSNKRSKKYYSENKQHHVDVIIKRNNKIKGESQNKLLEIFRKSSCKDCGNKDYRVFEFDHLPRYKKFRDVGNMLCSGYSWERILDEIKKCDIVCANCHRIRTIERTTNHYRKTEQAILAKSGFAPAS